jgi:hypothetical protein
MAYNRLTAQLTGDWGLRLRREDQWVRFWSGDSRNTSRQNG